MAKETGPTAEFYSQCCDALMDNAPKDYMYVIKNPDTRWFVCTECGAHWGYHRMKANWKVDPYDYTNNPKVRECLGLK